MGDSDSEWGAKQRKARVDRPADDAGRSACAGAADPLLAMSKVDPYPPLITVAGTAPCPRNTRIGVNEFMSDVARRTAVEQVDIGEEQDWLDTSPFDSPWEKPGDGVPWFELRLPWEKEPSYWRHPILSNRWRRMHYRILSLERALGIHSRWHEDVLPWCPRDMMC